MPSTLHKSGACREQALLLPARIEDYVGADNPVRAIEAYVAALDLVRLKFRHARRKQGAGQPPYHPGDLLKLYLYGYLNQVRSSRRLEREAARNVELIWLLRGLQPGFRTIAKFRSENAAALRQANRDFVMLLRALDLVDGSMVAIDGAFFDANASRASIVTRKRLDDELAAVEREIAQYTAALDDNDAQETAAESPAAVGQDMAARLAALMARRAAAVADVARLTQSGQTQVGRTDPDARLLSKNGQSLAGYNVQIAVEGAHKLIIAAEATNDGNDTSQLHAMAQAAGEALGAQPGQVVADCGYFNGETLKACEDDGIEAFVPEPRRGAKADGRFGPEDFAYDPEADAYRCPQGETLRPTGKPRIDATGKRRRRYRSRKQACARCPLRAKCLSAKGTRREIERWEHEDVLERHRARMADSAAMLRRRRALAEHPFGTLKCRAGYRHFLVRGFEKVRGELGLMVLCYNFTRLLNIIGLEKLIAWLAAWCFSAVFWLKETIVAAAQRLLGGQRRRGRIIRPRSTAPHSSPSTAPCARYIAIT